MNPTIVYSAAFVFSLGLYGCGSPAGSESTTQPGSPAAADAHSEHMHSDNTHGEHAHDSNTGLTDMEKMAAELAKLSPEDAASAEKQHICPVSGEMLGTVGAPIKLDVKGQQVWICCEDCRKELLENPDEYLGKLIK